MEETKTTEISTELDTLMNISRGLDYAMATPEQKEQRQDQLRTIKKKKIFLDYWARSMGVVSATCEKVEISRELFYIWMRKDPIFKEEIKRLVKQRNNIAEDLLWGKITINKDSGCIRYYLDRRHPVYKPRMVQEVIDGERTLDDIIAERRAEVKKAQDEYDKKHQPGQKTGTTNQQGTDRGPANDKKQEGDSGAVPVQHSPELLLGEDDAPKPDTQGEAKGTE